MLTAKNYFEQVKKLNILNRFPDAKDYHDFFADATNNGTDWQPYDTEKETKEIIDAYVAKLNTRLGKETKTENAPVVEQQSQQKKTSSATTHIKRGRKKGGANEKVSSRAKKAKQKSSGNKPSGKKPKGKILHLPKGKMVEIVDPHLLFVGRYLRMDKKVRSRNALENFFAQINKAADAKILRKASPYSGHIIYIQKQLLKRLESGAEEFTIEIPPPKYDHMLRAIAKEQQMASVRLLKRYHGMAGRATTIEKAKKLYNEMYNAIEQGKIPEQDRLHKRVIKVMRDLADYVKLEDPKRILERLPAELGGILGYMDGCLCQQDRELHGIDAPEDVEFGFFGEGRGDELLGAALPIDPKVPVPSTALKDYYFERLPVEEPWVELFGELTEGSTTMVKGDEKTGKSILMICFARYLAENFGKVLYITSEEGWSATTQNKFDETDTYHPNLYIVSEIPDDLDPYTFIVYDSVSKLGLAPEKFFNLKKEYPTKCFFGIFHLTHGGQQRGSREFSYDVDNIVTVVRTGVAIARGRLLGTSSTEVNFFDFCLSG